MLLEIALIYAAPLVMCLATGIIVFRRRDLLLPSLVGGFLTMAVYAGVSLLFQLLIPQVFDIVWHTEVFVDAFVLGTPVEERIDGFTSGLIGSIAALYILRARFTATET